MNHHELMPVSPARPTNVLKGPLRKLRVPLPCYGDPVFHRPGGQRQQPEDHEEPSDGCSV